MITRFFLDSKHCQVRHFARSGVRVRKRTRREIPTQEHSRCSDLNVTRETAKDRGAIVKYGTSHIYACMRWFLYKQTLRAMLMQSSSRSWPQVASMFCD